MTHYKESNYFALVNDNDHNNNNHFYFQGLLIYEMKELRWLVSC